MQESATVKVDGAVVPFKFHGNVMTVNLMPSDKPFLLTLNMGK